MIAAIIAGVAVLGGAIINGMSQSSAQDSANQTNVALAAQNRDWQTHMSNTSAQRGMADLRAAGLNPLLAAGGGAASTPSTSAAEVAASNPASGLGSMGSAMQSALDVKQTKAATELQEEQKTATQAQTQNTLNDSKKKVSETQLNNAAQLTELERAKQTAASARDISLRTNLLKATAPATIKKSQYEGDQAEYDRKMMDYDNKIKRIGTAIGTISSAADVASPIGKALKTVKEAKSKAELLQEVKNSYRRSR